MVRVCVRVPVFTEIFAPTAFRFGFGWTRRISVQLPEGRGGPSSFFARRLRNSATFEPRSICSVELAVEVEVGDQRAAPRSLAGDAREVARFANLSGPQEPSAAPLRAITPAASSGWALARAQ
jgi:hypothetical protein